MIPTRNTEMYAQYYWLMYTLMVIAIIIFCKGVYDHYKLWKLGKPERRERWWPPGPGIVRFIKGTLGHARILREDYPGTMHLMIFWGFIIFALGTVVHRRARAYRPAHLPGLVLPGVSFILNVFALLVIVAIRMALWRRLVARPEGIDSQTDDWVALALIFLIVATGLLLGGLLIAITQDPWAAWRPVEYLISTGFSGVDPQRLMGVHQVVWWIHVCLAMGFIAYIPYSKLFHIFAGPVNQYLARDKAAQSMQPLDLEDESIEQFGVAEIQQFTWKQLLDGDACIRCGRCQDNCPAYISGKPLSPKKLTQDLKNHLRVAAPKLAAALKATDEKKDEATPMPLAPDVIAEEEIWACTTCRSCEEQCPVFVEHVPKIVDLRRNLVMMECSFPSEAQTAFRGMENNGNPWNQGWKCRSDWTEGPGCSGVG